MGRLLPFLLMQMMRLWVEALLLLLGLGVRLLYWTVRTYGWGRMGLAVGLWTLALGLYGRLAGWPLQVPAEALLGAAALVAVGLPRSLWVRGAWWGRQGLERARVRLFRQQSRRAGPEGPLGAPAGGRSDLWSRLLQPDLLRAAWARVAEGGTTPGPDGVTLEAFGADLEANLARLREDLASGTCRPLPPRWVEVPKRSGGTRRLAVLAVRDRVVHQALLQLLTPLWDPHFAPCSYAYRPGRSALQAVAEVERKLRAGLTWVVDGDIRSFFDEVSHRRLEHLLEAWVPDERVRALLMLYVRASSPTPDRGLAQGAPTSPLLANLYLHTFDRAILDRGYALVRYADDFVVLCATPQQAEEAFRCVERALRALDLRIHPEKSRVVPWEEGFTFLGFHFSPSGKRPVREALEDLARRLAGEVCPERCRRILEGWMGYFDRPEVVAATSAPEGDPADLPLREGPGEGGGVLRAPAAVLLRPRGVEEAACPLPTPDDLHLFRERFVGRSDLFGRAWRRGGRQGYLPVRRSLGDEDLLAHLRGEESLGTYLLRPGGVTHALVLDVDGPTGEGREGARDLTARLYRALVEEGVRPLWVDTGGKGYHLWVCLSSAIPAAPLRRWADRLLDRFRPFPEGVLVEVFPKQDDLAPGALGALIRLPLGRHPGTGRRSRFLDPSGAPISDPWALLRSAEPVAPSALGLVEPTLPAPPPEVAPVVEGCALLRALVEKARRTGHLRHTERLALLYTLGHCGDAGQAYLHRVIALCRNYNPRITQRWIRRLEPGHRPLTCARLKEWLKDLLPGVTCRCPERPNPSPVDRTGTAPPPVPEGDELWEAVAHDLFDPGGRG